MKNYDPCNINVFPCGLVVNHYPYISLLYKQLTKQYLDGTILWFRVWNENKQLSNNNNKE